MLKGAIYCLPPLPEDEPDELGLEDLLPLLDDPEEYPDEDLELLPEEKLLLFNPELVPRLGVEYEELDLLLPVDE